ncbi:BnaA09g42280D [Brassica napus]|uniref:BnaA09g42280D protein n=1 Tax=Brassica napus TaxID=3708 RepID=A0A078IJ42_BRANA|nr:BnaA09g42280D [Brassica napus]
MEATSQPCFSHNYLRSSENYNSSLHSTRKQPAKPWKRPVTASLQRMHPRVYRVEPVNFKELVQRLTGAPQDHERDEVHQVETKPLLKIFHETTTQENPLAFDLSPSSSRFWEAFPLLSPANLSRW